MQSFSLSFFYATLKQEPSVKNKRDRLFFTQLFVPQASQSSYDRRTELEVLFAIPSAQSACGMEIRIRKFPIGKGRWGIFMGTP